MLLKSEAWDFILLNKQYLDCKVILDSKNYLTSKCFIPRYVCSIDLSTIEDLEVIIFSEFSFEEVENQCGSFFYDESNQNILRLKSVESDKAQSNDQNESFVVLNDVADVQKLEEISFEYNQSVMDNSSSEDTVILKGTQSNIKSTNQVMHWQCHICGKIFDKSKALRQHRFLVHRDQEYKCNVCSSVFKTKCNLNIHSKTHLKPSFQCQKCSKGNS